MNVREIQTALAARGFDPGPIDGDAGARTVTALKAFQKARGVLADGIAGPLTIAALVNQDAPPARALMPEPTWLILARAELGTVEGIGKSNNPKVVRYYADAGFAGVKDDEVAWCAAFVGAMLHRASVGNSGSLAARSYESWGVGLPAPILGCVATKKRGGSSWQGHVGFVVGASASSVILLGGNQADGVSIATFKRSEFTSFRWPVGIPRVTGRLPTTIAGAKSGVSEA